MAAVGRVCTTALQPGRQVRPRLKTKQNKKRKEKKVENTLLISSKWKVWNIFLTNWMGLAIAGEKSE